jgi:hypothetical protein
LLEDDGEWRRCLEEATGMHTGQQLRQLFVTLLLFGEPSQPDQLWMAFRDHICDDLEHRLQSRGVTNLSPGDIYDYGLFLINQLLTEYGRLLLEWPSMPKFQRDWQMLARNPLIAEQLDYDRVALQADLEDRLGKLNDCQRLAYDRILASIDTGRVFFMSGSGGAGKTFVYNTVCAKLRGPEGKIVLCVSSSGISALLLRGGRTSYSMFKIPIEGLDDHSVCAIPKNSDRADLMRATTAIIWDEVGAQHRLAIEAVDRTLRDLRGCDRPFGGITVVLGGDFLQTLPVVPGGSREETVDATVQRSTLWNDIEVLHLQGNMRLDRADADAEHFAQWLLDVGHGRNMIDDLHVRLPASWRVPDGEALLHSIYPGINSDPPPPPDYFLNRMILAPRNSDVWEMNEQILGHMPGQARQYIAVDQVIQEAGADPVDADPIPVEFLRSITTSTLAPGELNLKVGCPAILLRNLAPTRGLCNGTRMIITRMRDRVLEVQLLGGDHDGEMAMIPRISMVPPISEGLAFRFKRLQFPVRLAFALSVNKAQGQSVRYVGLDLRMPVFSHGQLYVALSRATCSRNIKVLLPNDTDDSITPNVVYKEVLI